MCGYCGAPLPAAESLPAHEVRKTVTLIFSDLKDSTALGERLDNEALHEVKERYFSAMAAEIKRHGGKIEKYIGDAIMAVFGLPRAHEDDALRAVRAAIGMKAVLNGLNEQLTSRFGVVLANRTGVNTGEVVAVDDPNADQKLATGDAVNVTARLEQAAPANEIYIGEVTYRLVRDAVEVEPVEPLTLKGKSQPVAAYRLISAHGHDGNVRRHDTPVVGRDDELAVLQRAWETVVTDRRAGLVTVIGDAGVGKSRLVRELLDRVGGRARIIFGRCLAYGEGITFWPLRGMVVEAAKVLEDDPPEVAREKILACVGDDDVADRLAAATGLSARQFPLHEIYWGARRFMQLLARERPVVAMIDDIHWAEPAFLDLLEHLLETVEDAPVLMLATARHELLEERTNWGERERSNRLVLQPLADSAAQQVVTNLIGAAGLPGTLMKRIVDAAEGNPLYVEQMLAMLIDTGAVRQEGGKWVGVQTQADIAVPPTIQALLEARLDNLQRSERAAAEPAAVIGLEFPQSAVQALAPQPLRSSIEVQLTALSRKHFIRPATTVDADSRYRFDHHLVRDTVYNGLLKRARATMHVEFVKWADQVNAESDRGQEFEAILGYHLEQAYKYLGELGPIDEAGAAIGRDGAKRLASAGRRAFQRGDMHASANLYSRAIKLMSEDDQIRLGLLPAYAEVHVELGDFAEARTIAAECLSKAQAKELARVKIAAEQVGMFIRLYSGERGSNWSDDAQRVAQEAITVLTGTDAHDELSNSYRLIALVHQNAGRLDEAATTIGLVAEHARLAGNQRMVARSGLGLSLSALFGPTPVPDAIARVEAILAGGLADRQVASVIRCRIAQLRAMNGDFEIARDLYRQARNTLRELGQGVHAASTGLDVIIVELLAGDLAGGEAEVRADYAFLQEHGETYFLASMAALLARIVREQGRDQEALDLSIAAEEAAAEHDLDAQVRWRTVRAPILARVGKFNEAKELAESALTIARKTGLPILQADALFDLAVTRLLSDEIDGASAALAEARALYRSKGDRASLEHLERWSREHMAQ